MNVTSHGWAIAALFVTSLLVRVLPAFIRIHPSEVTRKLVERVLPMAVFVNFSIYIAWTEIQTSAVAAIAGIATAAIASLFTRAGLVLTTCVSTLVYALATTAWSA